MWKWNWRGGHRTSFFAYDKKQWTCLGYTAPEIAIPLPQLIFSFLRWKPKFFLLGFDVCILLIDTLLCCSVRCSQSNICLIMLLIKMYEVSPVLSSLRRYKWCCCWILHYMVVVLCTWLFLLKDNPWSRNKIPLLAKKPIWSFT